MYISIRKTGRHYYEFTQNILVYSNTNCVLLYILHCNTITASVEQMTHI